MCGICGIFEHGHHEGTVFPETLEFMNQAMLHRGPDDGGVLVDGNFGMAMRRLSIIDIDGGSQPIKSEDGRYAIVFNGEIYNFVELRLELLAAGHEFTSLSDTEVILHGYEEWGVGVANRLNGMFGFAIWDSQERELVLARDHYGIKPLYFRADEDRLIFASELRCLFASGLVNREIDPAALKQFFRYRYVPAPLTAFRGVLKLQPGYALRIRQGASCEVTRFSTPPKRIMGLNEAESTDLLRAALVDAVTRQMVADVPIGLMLSGGVDSALVGHLMAGANATPIKTFTVAFAEDTKSNELEAAAATARLLGADHHELVISQSEYADFLPMSIFSLEEPIATPSTLAFRRLCEFARSEVAVALTGQGADELFGGYPRYAFESAMTSLSAVPPSVMRIALRVLRATRPTDEKVHRAVQAYEVSEPCAHIDAVNRLLNEGDMERLIGSGALRDAAAPNPFVSWCADVCDEDPVYGLQYVDARTMLPDNLLLYGDKVSMSASLEIRVPFLDRAVAELIEGLPTSEKVRGLQRKRILRRAARKWVDPGTLNRKKVNFSVPIGEWLQGDLGLQMEKLVADPDSLSATWLDAAAVLSMLQEHRSGVRDYAHILFSVLTAELWHAQFIAPSDGPQAISVWGRE